MGRNGSGKSSLLWALQGTGRRASAGRAGRRGDPAQLAPARARRLVGLVPQTPADLLYLDTVEAELAEADRDAATGTRATGARATGARARVPGPARAAAPRVARGLLDEIAPGIPAGTHPRDLSAGQQLALVLAIQLRAGPDVILLDEPTRGLDYRAKASLTAASPARRPGACRGGRHA